MAEQANRLLEFGPYRVDSQKRLLSRGGQPIPLASKAFDTLLVLIEHKSEVVSKEDLMKAIWPDSFVEESNLSQSIFLLRKALGETAQDHQFIVTIPGKGYRLAERVREVPTDETDLLVESHSRSRIVVDETGSSSAGFPFQRIFRNNRKIILLLLTVGVLLIGGAVFIFRSRKPPMNAADLVLVSDFVNTTGESIFDGSLKQALNVKLAESPFFNVVPDSKNRQTLGFMGRSPEERLLPPISREVCQREGAKVVVGGSILSVANRYVVTVDATNCLTGDSVSRQSIEAATQEQVLSGLGDAIPKMRRKLGESLSSIQKFDTPIERATTKSLAALKTYTSGDEKRASGHEADSIPFYKMAAELDPEFAIAYARLGTVYGNLGQPDVATDYLRKAFERRDHVSEREKFYIQAHYYEDGTKEIDKANEAYELWTEVYPRDFLPFNSLSSGYITVGQFDKAITAGQQALRLNPNHALGYASLSRAYERASRFAEAKAICDRAVTEKVDSHWTHQALYRIAFVEGDEQAMQEQINWFKGKPQEGLNTYFQAKVAMSQGRLKDSRELFERARSMGRDRGLEEVATAVVNSRAQFEADLGQSREARLLAGEVLHETPVSPRHRAFAALALARAGDVERSQLIVKEVSQIATLGTGLSDVVLPAIRAAIDMNRKNPTAAIEHLRPAIPYDLGSDSGGVTLYYRGVACLDSKEGKAAAAQFQMILDNRGVVSTDIYWPLAHLGLARALALTGETQKSLETYREFLALWKNADQDLEFLKQAKAEYKRLSVSSTQP